MSVASAQYWDTPFELDTYTKDEVLFWEENLTLTKSRNCFLDQKPHVLAYSDASSTGCGAVVQLDKAETCHKLWQQTEKTKSSTWRELAAVEFSIESFLPILSDAHVMWYTEPSSS
jgi:hypothetical protein